jgi:hypothetical protein
MSIKTNNSSLLVAGTLLFASLVGFSAPSGMADENEMSLSDRLHQRSMHQISLNIAPPGGEGADGKPYPLPADHASREFALPLQPEFRSYIATEVHPLGDWNFCYQPLLFEEVNAERYGEVCFGLQPGISAAKFYARTMILPLTVVTKQARKPAYFWHPERPGYGGIHERVH